MRLRNLVPLLALGLLAACASPRETCLDAATAPWRGAMQERARIAKALARGYTFQTEFMPVARVRTCRDDSSRLYPCWEGDLQAVTRRNPVDTEKLRARDAELARRLPTLRETANTNVAQCRATYPSGQPARSATPEPPARSDREAG